uniref:Uncharacterized protein n=1 Tax=Chromera velia CCMP2878 TaxID=1169474 RepID=A0A0G4I847_9ALVE|eukprot:Cvel_11780.t1-p1 / transcript=Cvel_11780.t1 / gene=Cvel_11780 / organism=Chromera_velia_CCMP2878 / gene_product=hypothetical protein / transcript_product=hypothetical protein / location=Cvel_scaffold749:42394-43711(-) / protein_length=90 / sequence_SO=supercontig / SO=protein_coding / is_pseudo=false
MGLYGIGQGEREGKTLPKSAVDRVENYRNRFEKFVELRERHLSGSRLSSWNLQDAVSQRALGLACAGVGMEMESELEAAVLRLAAEEHLL